jgi:hypothetical protein
MYFFRVENKKTFGIVNNELFLFYRFFFQLFTSYTRGKIEVELSIYILVL